MYSGWTSSRGKRGNRSGRIEMQASMSNVQIGVGVAIALVSVPLILRLVPKNHIYGIRTPRAFVSERNWYDINAFGGWVFLVFGCILIGLGSVLQQFAPEPTSPWASAFVALPFVLLIPVLIVIGVYSRRFPDR
jgi:uncharacterized membrane protein